MRLFCELLLETHCGLVPVELAPYVVGSVFRGNDRLLRSDDAAYFFLLVEQFGLEDVWLAYVADRRFRVRDLMTIQPHMRLDLNAMSQTDCINAFRFDRDQIRAIVSKLPFEDVIITYQRDRCYSVEAFCIVLNRMSYPKQWHVMSKTFGRFPSALSRIFSTTMKMILQRAMPSILMYPVTQERMEMYREALVALGVPANLRISHVLDAKKEQSCKPQFGEQQQWSVHKSGHGFKYQTAQAPDGLIAHCSNAADGRNADPGILGRSGLVQFWRNHPILRNYRLLADSAYPTNDVIIALFKRPPNGVLHWAFQLFNSTVSPPRSCVEWGYKQVVGLWAFVDFKKTQKIGLVSVEAFWHLACWLTNLHTCANGGNQISTFFGVAPPSLEEFLHDTFE